MRGTASWVVLAVTACTGGGTPSEENDDDNTADETPETPPGPPEPECDLDVDSACGNDASVVQGQVRLEEGLTTETEGNLYLALNHEAYAGAIGGGYHIFDVIRDVDLSEPVPFALDMCAGGAMWSDTNCTYTLIAILDLNEDQSAENALPDAGEPTGRAVDITLSCDGEAPCLDVVLDCVDGADCASFTDAECSCDPQGCSSITSICNL